MLNRKTIAAIASASAIATAGVSAPALADDADARTAQTLVAEARTYGEPGVTGQAAGTVERERRDDDRHDANTRRWREIARSQSLN